jgi:hypothetical protein
LTKVRQIRKLPLSNGSYSKFVKYAEFGNYLYKSG